MNRIDTNQVSDSGGSLQPWTTKSLNFLQNAVIDSLGSLANGVLGGADYYTNPVVISGLHKPTATSIAAGVFSAIIPAYGTSREIFYCSACANTALLTGAITLVPDITNDTTIDPVQFSDGVTKSIHKIRRFKIVGATSGPMDPVFINYSSLIFANAPKGTVFPGGSGWSGGIDYWKINNIVYLSGAAYFNSSSPLVNPPFATITLPEAYRPHNIKHLSVNYMGRTTTTSTPNPFASIWRVMPSGIINIAAGGMPGFLGAQTSTVAISTAANTFYFTHSFYVAPYVSAPPDEEIVLPIGGTS